jgi:hypothetical protein
MIALPVMDEQRCAYGNAPFTGSRVSWCHAVHLHVSRATEGPSFFGKRNMVTSFNLEFCMLFDRLNFSSVSIFICCLGSQLCIILWLYSFPSAYQAVRLAFPVQPFTSARPKMVSQRRYECQRKRISQQHYRPCRGFVEPRKINQSKVGFFDLPGEVRNDIYEYYFDTPFRTEIGPSQAKFGPVYDTTPPPLEKQHIRAIKCLRLTFRKNSPKQSKTEPRKVRTTTAFAGHGRKLNVPDKDIVNWESSISGLMLVCKQVYAETVQLHYAYTTFAFSNSINRLEKFISNTPIQYLSCIHNMEIHYRSYGHPVDPQLQGIKEKTDKKWHSICTTASLKLVGLKKLRITAHVIASPYYLEFSETWVKPLLEFRRLAFTTTTTDNTLATRALHSLSDQATNVPTPSLTDVEIHISSDITRPGAMAFSEVEDANCDLHRLFSKAISHYIMGMDEEDAMQEYKEACTRKYIQWRYYLRLNRYAWWRSHGFNDGSWA